MVTTREKIFIYIFAIAALALSSVARAQPAIQSTTIQMAEVEIDFLNTINHFRKKMGLNELRIHIGLQRAAEKHSKWMAEQDILKGDEALSHNGPAPNQRFSDRILLEGYSNHTILGENVSCGSESAVETFKQFAFSPKHLANMMSPRFRHIGIARAGTGKETCPFYWTTDFGSKEDPETDPSIVTDIRVIGNAIDAAAGTTNAAATLQAPVPPTVVGTPAENEVRNPTDTPNDDLIRVKCMIPNRLGNGNVSYAANVDTTLEVTPQASGYMMKLHYKQNGTDVRFASLAIFGAAAIKNSFYPLVTLFSAPTTKVGGFIVQVDAATGRAQFDPYPGQGGSSGMIQCKFF